MPTIINPIRSGNPLGQALSQLGQQMFGDTLTPALKREQLLSAQRENVEYGRGRDMLASGNLDPNQFMGSAYAAGRSGSDIGNLLRTFSANNYGASDQRTTNSMLGAGDAFSSTPQGFGMSLGETQRQFDHKPMEALVGGQPAFVPQSGAFGEDVSPILSNTDRQGTIAGQHFGNMGDLPPEEQSYLGAEPRSPGTPRNYIAGGRSFITFDGVTDAQTGAPLPPGGYIGNVEGSAEDTGLLRPNVQSELQSTVVAADRFTNLADRMIGLAEEDPTLFGLVGSVRSFGQEAGEVVGAAATLLGDDPDQAAAEVRKSLAAQGKGYLMPEMYDRNLPKVEMLGGILLYSGASALAGQENRSVSDKDIEFMKRILGDPRSWWTGATSVATKVSLAREIVQEHKRMAQQMLQSGMQIPQDGSLVEAAAATVMGRDGAPAERPDDEIVGEDDVVDFETYFGGQ